MHGERQDRTLVRRLCRDPLEFVRTAHARCALRISQLQLLTRQRECVESDDPCERVRHVLRIGVRSAIDAKKFMMRVVLMSVNRVLQPPEHRKIRIEPVRLGAPLPRRAEPSAPDRQDPPDRPRDVRRQRAPIRAHVRIAPAKVEYIIRFPPLQIL